VSDYISVTVSATVTFCSNLKIQFSNYINDGTTQSETATATARNSTGGVSTTTSITISYTASTMTSVTLTPQSNIVDGTDRLLVSFTIGTFSITDNFSIIMTFPARFSTTQSYFPNAIS
jgi:hypothetical protein